MEPPPPPPHGHQYAAGGGGAPPGGGGAGAAGGGYPGGASGLPPGKYDIFVIPPHSSGSGFLYLPSLQPHRNSFLAGVACTLVVVSAWTVLLPVMKQWFHLAAASGGAGMVLLMGGMGVAGWAWGKTQTEGGPGGSPRPGPGGASGAYAAGAGAANGAPPPPGGMPGQGGGPAPGANPFGGHQYAGAQQQQTPPKSSWQRKPEPSAGSTPKGAWEKAREEARKREEERKKAEELRKKAEELLKKREEEEKERVRLREKEARERREREARDAARERARAAGAASTSSPPKSRGAAPPPRPTARTEADEEAYSYRPYDKPRPAATARTAKTTASSSSSAAYSEAWDAASQSTRRTTPPPPPSHRGPYSTKDPDKIVIKAVYAYTSAFHNAPIAQLVSGSGSVTDGLILRITTEGLFIDDDVRGVPQREWDVKAWTMKLVETGDLRGMHVVRATIRDADGKRYVFVLAEEEGWKVAVGLQRLRRGTQVRSLGVSGLSQNETKAILANMGFL